MKSCRRFHPAGSNGTDESGLHPEYLHHPGTRHPPGDRAVFPAALSEASGDIETAQCRNRNGRRQPGDARIPAAKDTGLPFRAVHMLRERESDGGSADTRAERRLLLHPAGRKGTVLPTDRQRPLAFLLVPPDPGYPPASCRTAAAFFRSKNTAGTTGGRHEGTGPRIDPRDPQPGGRHLR